MPDKIEVYYEGWSEHWLWGTLVSSTALTGRPVILFEYSDEALRKGLELSSYQETELIIEKICEAAASFAALCQEMFHHQITFETRNAIQATINANIKRLLN